MHPYVCIGMVAYNGEKHIAEAIESLLAQTYEDFRLIVVDDCSTDNTKQIALQYASRDERISFFHNEKRVGYAGNSRIAFTLAGDNVDYFAWAADHDIHHPCWLETLIQVLNEHPEVVMAYPLAVRISDTGENLRVPSPMFDTFGLDVKERIKALYSEGVGFGNMIYGLFRADALRKVGVFRSFLLPDVLLLWELSLYGSYKQVREELWFRRYVGLFSVDRQRRNVFATPPWYAYVPWPFVNSASLIWNTVLSPRAGRLSKRCLGLYLTLMYFLRYLPHVERDSPSVGKYLLIPYRIGHSFRRRLTRIT